MENVTKPEQVVFLGVLFFVFCVVAWWWLHSGNKEERTPVNFDPVEIVGDTWRAILHWRPIPVKHSDDSASHVMSRSEDDDPPYVPSLLQTDDVQTPDQTAMAAARRRKLLDTYRPLRRLGMTRDDARAFLKTWDIPLDNNLWTEAAPPDPEDAPHVTPIVGRPTSARFETDADYPYRAPA